MIVLEAKDFRSPFQTTLSQPYCYFCIRRLIFPLMLTVAVQCEYICVQIIISLCCVCVIRLSHAHTVVIVGLLKSSSMYICVGVTFVLFFSCESYQVVSLNNMYFGGEIDVCQGIENFIIVYDFSQFLLFAEGGKMLYVFMKVITRCNKLDTPTGYTD